MKPQAGGQRRTCFWAGCIASCASTDMDSVITSAQATLAFSAQLMSGRGTASVFCCSVRSVLHSEPSAFCRWSVAL